VDTTPLDINPTLRAAKLAVRPASRTRRARHTSKRDHMKEEQGHTKRDISYGEKDIH